MLNSNQFTYTDQTFVAFASDLGDFRPERIYPDACDVGFKMESERTGVVATYYLAEVERKDGDVAAWHFNPTSESIRKIAGIKGTKVTIFNT